MSIQPLGTWLRKELLKDEASGMSLAGQRKTRRKSHISSPSHFQEKPKLYWPAVRSKVRVAKLTQLALFVYALLVPPSLEINSSVEPPVEPMYHLLGLLLTNSQPRSSLPSKPV